jgi:hypothetical protein
MTSEKARAIGANAWLIVWSTVKSWAQAS